MKRILLALSVQLSAFSMLGGPVYFPITEMTGLTNDVVVNVRAVNNPVVWNNRFYYLPEGGTNLTTSGGTVTNSFVPGRYTVTVAGLAQSWLLNVTNNTTAVSAADLSRGLTIYSGIQSLTGYGSATVTNDSFGNYGITATGGGTSGAITNHDTRDLTLEGALFTGQGIVPGSRLYFTNANYPGIEAQPVTSAARDLMTETTIPGSVIYNTESNRLQFATGSSSWETVALVGDSAGVSLAEVAAFMATNTAGSASNFLGTTISAETVFATSLLDENGLTISGSSNTTHHAVYGDSIMAGVGAESINTMPNKILSLGAPWLSISQTNVTRNKDGTDYTHYTGCWPGDNSIIIVNAAVDATNAANRNSFSHLWLGHNDFSQNLGAAFPSAVVTNQIATNILRLINWLGHSNYLVYPVLGDTNWTIGTTYYQNLTNFNDWLSNYFAPSGHFVDYLPDLMRQAAGATDQAQTNMGTAPWRFFNGPIHPYAAGHYVIATNAYRAVERLLNRTPTTVATVLEMQRRFTPVAYGSVTWGSPTYCPSWTPYNYPAIGGGFFGGVLSGAAGYGLAGSVDGILCVSNTGTYAIFRIPSGQWTNFDLTLTFSTDAPNPGTGGAVMFYGNTLTQSTNSLNFTATATAVTTITGVKSNDWATVTITGIYPNSTSGRQFQLYVKSASNGNLTNRVFINRADWRGYNY